MKLTPLNIVIACFLTWTISEWGNDQLIFSWWKVLLFLVVVSAVDLLFRSLVRNLKKLWLNEIAFILIAGILMIVLKNIWR
ncbi:hypothetical protein [Sphingobacterium sp. LRF_L2]|uniref:hypothetical protein n=1 Tax=Sphingobacterium sp. LRF_L2 TaxID=3369421 RepID=UPI003F623E7B